MSDEKKDECVKCEHKFLNCGNCPYGWQEWYVDSEGERGWVHTWFQYLDHVDA